MFKRSSTISPASVLIPRVPLYCSIEAFASSSELKTNGAAEPRTEIRYCSFRQIRPHGGLSVRSL